MFDLFACFCCYAAVHLARLLPNTEHFHSFLDFLIRKQIGSEVMPTYLDSHNSDLVRNIFIIFTTRTWAKSVNDECFALYNSKTFSFIP